MRPSNGQGEREKMLRAGMRMRKCQLVLIGKAVMGVVTDNDMIEEGNA